MDTLEFWSDFDESRPTGEKTSGQSAPILWRNKTPQEVARERYPDRNFLTKSTHVVPKSMSPDAEYCETYYCQPHGESKESYKMFGTLVGIPTRK